ncbi:uncharacterized protein LOC131182806 [Hevea brasiliensis]|uniref:uncharacterized protein LOC131182806 n=1 Tax=Hevea brasiliensis TaxID=3981 RepID=UPI0025CE6836|nr:uncharacterized protein LOC131182806 [Hevea brasiliensis]
MGKVETKVWKAMGRTTLPPIFSSLLSSPLFFFFLSPVTGRRLPKRLPTRPATLRRRPEPPETAAREGEERENARTVAAAFRLDSGFIRRPIEAIQVALESLFRELSFDFNFVANGRRMSEIWRRKVSSFSSFFVRSTMIRLLDRRSETTYGLRKRRGTWWYNQIRQMSPAAGHCARWCRRWLRWAMEMIQLPEASS